MTLRPGASGSTTASSAASGVRSDVLGLISGAPVTPPAVSPTVLITDSVSGSAASVPVTFTFTFSEAVTGFAIEDIVANASIPNAFVPEAPPDIVAATKSSFVAVSSTVYTVVVTPPYLTQGTLQVSVPAGAALSASSQGNLASAVALQGYNFSNIDPPAPPEEPPPPVLLVTLDLTASEAEVLAAGQVVTFTATVQNASEVSTSTTVTSTLGGTLASNATLTPTQSVSYSYQYTVTEADIAAGSLADTVTATGGATLATDTVTLLVGAALETAVSASATPVYSAGEVVVFTVSVANTGPVPVTGITVTTSLGATLASNVSLNPSQTATYTQSYTLLQADADAGSVTCVATASSARAAVSSASTTKVVEAVGQMLINVTPVAYLDRGELGTFSDGDQIKYSIIIANTGSISLTNISVSVTNAQLLDNSAIASLAPGATTTRVAYHIPYSPLSVNTYPNSYSGGSMVITTQSAEGVTASRTETVEWLGEPLTYPQLVSVQVSYEGSLAKIDTVTEEAATYVFDTNGITNLPPSPTSDNTQTEQLSVANFNYQWQQAPTADGAYVNISGAIAPRYSVPQPGPEFVRVVLTRVVDSASLTSVGLATVNYQEPPVGPEPPAPEPEPAP